MQIDKYNSAVHVFQNKYSGLPGDLQYSLASQFGFTTGINCLGQSGGRDGNGTIDGWVAPSLVQAEGETALFWQDLSSAGLIDGVFPNSGASAITCNAGGAAVLTITPGSAYVGTYFPAAKIGYSTFIYVYEVNGVNWYGISAVTNTFAGGRMYSNVAIPVRFALALDSKMDDGPPTTGKVQTIFLHNFAVANAPSAPNDSSATCYNTTSNIYSTSINDGMGSNCALSFQFE